MAALSHGIMACRGALAETVTDLSGLSGRMRIE